MPRAYTVNAGHARARGACAIAAPLVLVPAPDKTKTFSRARGAPAHDKFSGRRLLSKLILRLLRSVDPAGIATGGCFAGARLTLTTLRLTVFDAREPIGTVSLVPTVRLVVAPAQLMTPGLLVFI